MKTTDREYAIDFLKFFAAILITNSHIKVFEPAYILSTGGSIGDVLFLFCSGFTLFLGKLRRFDNWYKRRLTRIFPPVICWSILATFIFGENRNIDNIIINGGGWFVQCILIYYLLAFPIRKYASKYIVHIMCVVTIIVCVWFFTIDKGTDFMIYGWNYCKWAAFFLFFLQGAYVGIQYKHNLQQISFAKSLLILICCMLCWYGVLYIQSRFDLPIFLQLISLLPLLGTSIYFFLWCRSSTMEQIFNNRYLNSIIRGIGGLCFEIYLVQNTLYHYLHLPVGYPYNIAILWCLILFWAYALHVFNNFVLQTIREQDYNWRKIIRIF